jgi:hypothetical protein
MAWADLVAAANVAFIATWGIPATLEPQDGSGPFSFTGIIKNPGMEEEVSPGGAAGTSVVRFWVDYSSISPQPVMGDSVTINSISYTVGKVETDIEAGAVLRLRKNA